MATRNFGRVGVLRISELVFAIGTAFVGLANGIIPLIIGRWVQHVTLAYKDKQADDQDHDWYRFRIRFGLGSTASVRDRTKAV